MPVTIKELEINTSVADRPNDSPKGPSLDVEALKRELLEVCADMIRQSHDSRTTR